MARPAAVGDYQVATPSSPPGFRLFESWVRNGRHSAGGVCDVPDLEHLVDPVACRCILPCVRARLELEPFDAPVSGDEEPADAPGLVEPELAAVVDLGGEREGRVPARRHLEEGARDVSADVPSELRDEREARGEGRDLDRDAERRTAGVVETEDPPARLRVEQDLKEVEPLLRKKEEAHGAPLSGTSGRRCSCRPGPLRPRRGSPRA